MTATRINPEYAPKDLLVAEGLVEKVTFTLAAADDTLNIVVKLSDGTSRIVAFTNSNVIYYKRTASGTTRLWTK